MLRNGKIYPGGTDDMEDDDPSESKTEEHTEEHTEERRVSPLAEDGACGFLHGSM